MTNAQTKRCRWKEVLLGIGCLLILVGLMAFGLVSFSIGRDVRSVSELAIQCYGGYSVEALICRVEDANESLREINHAVWALGQLGDRRALPALRKHYTGQPCDHAKELCQRELAKAIRLIDGGINAAAWIWRGQ